MKYQILINDTIGWPISANYIRSLMSKLQGQPVGVFVNSYGGSVCDALDIRQQFIDHGDVTVYIEGMTASAATILAMGAKKIVMGKYALMLIHKCSSWIDTWGSLNADELEKEIAKLRQSKEDLDTIDEVIANLYAARCGKKPQDIAEIMKKGAWLTADECKEIGLIDEIRNEDKPTIITDEEKHRITACGYPIPQERNFAENSEPNEKLLVSLLKKIFGKSEQPKGENVDQPLETNNNNTNTMKKNFLNVCAFLAMEALTFSEDGKTFLTEEQVSTVEDKIKALAEEKKTAEDKISSMQAQIDALNEQVKNLKEAPGDTTKDVVEDEEEKIDNPMASAQEQFKKIQGII